MKLRGLSSAMLWLGLILCIAVAYRSWGEFNDIYDRFVIRDVLLIMAAMIAIAVASASSWASILVAVTGRRLPASAVFRQVALLLVGKYIPGGVFGFLARLRDGMAWASASRLAAAGILEQCLGVVVLGLCGAVFYLSAMVESLSLLILLLPLPWVALLGIRVMLLCIRMLPLRRLRAAVEDLAAHGADTRRVLVAVVWTQLSVLGWLGIACFVSMRGGGMELLPAIGMGGSFAIGIAAGIVAVVVPGGIGVREATTVLLAMPFADSAVAVMIVAMLRVASVAYDLLFGATAVAVSMVASYPVSSGPSGDGS